MYGSESRELLYTAMAKAQGELSPAPKSSINPHFKSRYADLATCMEAARPVLAKYDLFVSQAISTSIETQTVAVTTTIGHKSGQWMASTVECKPARGLLPQEVGTAATYLRRYAFSAMIGLITEEDDDGNKAQGLDKPAAKTPEAKPETRYEPIKPEAQNQPPSPTATQLEALVSAFAKFGVKKFQIEDFIGCGLEAMTGVQFKAIRDIYAEGVKANHKFEMFQIK
jgi:hypothetical protein